MQDLLTIINETQAGATRIQEIFAADNNVAKSAYAVDAFEYWGMSRMALAACERHVPTPIALKHLNDKRQAHRRTRLGRAVAATLIVLVQRYEQHEPAHPWTGGPDAA